MVFINQFQPAVGVPFDNTTSGLTATNVQDAIDEIQAGIIIGLPTHAITHLPNGIDPLTTAAPSTLNPDVANTEGTANAFSRADHIHNVPANVAVSTGTTNAEGDSTSFSRANHVHNTVIANANAYLNTTTTTTSGTFALLNGMQVTVPSDGSYLIFASAQARISFEPTTINFAIYIDTTQDDTSVANLQQDRAPSDVTYSLSIKRTLTAGQTVSIYWSRSAGTATARARSITIMRVG